MAVQLLEELHSSSFHCKLIFWYSLCDVYIKLLYLNFQKIQAKHDKRFILFLLHNKLRFEVSWGAFQSTPSGCFDRSSEFYYIPIEKHSKHCTQNNFFNFNWTFRLLKFRYSILLFFSCVQNLFPFVPLLHPELHLWILSEQRYWK